MKKNNKTGVLLNVSLKKQGITIYVRDGVSVVRPSMSKQSPRRTESQFDIREQTAYFTHVWHYIRTPCRNLFQGPTQAFYQFRRLAAKLPPLYLTVQENTRHCTPLLPGTPLSNGTLPDIGCRLGTLDGSPALLTDLTPEALEGDRLTLVTLRQLLPGVIPRLYARVRPVGDDELVERDGRLALTGDDYGDPRRGWALVRCRGALRSTQTLVTASTLYLQYTTPEARQRALASYGGLLPRDS